jgi:hypothetical protein
VYLLMSDLINVVLPTLVTLDLLLEMLGIDLLQEDQLPQQREEEDLLVCDPRAEHEVVSLSCRAI